MKNRVGAHRRVTTPHGGTRSHPKSSLRPPRSPKRSPKDTFRRPGVSIWMKMNDSGPLREPLYLLWFKHIYRSRGRAYSISNCLGDAMGSRSVFFLSFGRPRCTKVRLKGTTGCPMCSQSLQKTVREPPKINEKSTWWTQGVPELCWGALGYPPARKVH